MRKIWDKLVQLLYKVPWDKQLHFFAGLIVAAFFAITFGMKACLVPVIFAGLAKEFFDKKTTQLWDWWDFLATCLGGLLIQLFVLLHLLIF